MLVSSSQRPAADRASACEDAYLSSGPSPTLHLLGVGKVGQAFLRQFPAAGPRLRGVSDRSATWWRRQGLAPREVAGHKERGRPLADRPEARALPVEVLTQVCRVDAFVDCVGSSAGAGEALTRARACLTSGAALVLASKDALAAAPGWFLHEVDPGRLGIDAVLGGTGTALQEERAWLHPRCRAVSLVCNATSTVVVEAIERGAAAAEAVAEARHRGLLEGDPGEDLDGLDAARKLVLVAAAALGREEPVGAVVRARFAALDLDEVRARVRRGLTTRLVARADQDGGLRVAYEALPRTSSLGVSGRQVAYCYHLDHGRRRLHVGDGLGPERTARALWGDVRRLLWEGGAR